ncbi:MAG TPA: hypothetical protein VKV28_15760 [Candidatus Binataceae bacterium]|nr:hypothetical protein [Candidatus Binataceae bacterium]
MSDTTGFDLIFRGRGLARLLAETLISEAQKIDYARMVLDGLPSLNDALSRHRRREPRPLSRIERGQKSICHYDRTID